jgi:hypothetical protein
VLCVCDCIANNTFQEGLENTPRLLVDHCSKRQYRAR